MPFPKILCCLVCEDIRREVHKKNTLVGFLGATPLVKILVRDFARPLDRLNFLLVAPPAEAGRYSITAEIRDPNGNVLFSWPEARLEATPGPHTQMTLAIGLAGGLRIPGPGTYQFKLFVDGEEGFSTTFQITQGKPDDFAEK